MRVQRLGLLIGLGISWAFFLLTWAMPSTAQGPYYVACATLTPAPSSSLPSTLTPRPTSTTVGLPSATTSPSPTATRPLPTNVTPAAGTPSEEAPIFQAATQLAVNRQTPGYNPSTAIAQTAQAFYAANPLPTMTMTFRALYQVVAVAGMNLRAQPTTASASVGLVRFGDRVMIGEHRQVGAITWGWAVDLNGWVALMGREVIYLRAVSEIGQ